MKTCSFSRYLCKISMLFPAPTVACSRFPIKIFESGYLDKTGIKKGTRKCCATYYAGMMSSLRVLRDGSRVHAILMVDQVYEGILVE